MQSHGHTRIHIHTYVRVYLSDIYRDMPFIPLNKKSFVSVFVRKGIYYKGRAVPHQIYCFITMRIVGVLVWGMGMAVGMGMGIGIPFGDKGQSKSKEMAGKYLAHEGEKQTARLMGQRGAPRGGKNGERMNAAFPSFSAFVSLSLFLRCAFPVGGGGGGGGGTWVDLEGVPHRRHRHQHHSHCSR